MTFEGKGPHGVLVIVETASDNVTRTTANVNHILINLRVL